MRRDIAERFRYHTVPLALMQQLQSIAKHRATAFLGAYREQQGLAALSVG
jgi:hypothetical protein